MKIKYCDIQQLLFPVIFFLTVSPAHAATISFTGEIGYVEYDTGSSIYSGVSIGDLFSGGFTYGDSAAEASSIIDIAPTGTHYSFTGAPYGGYISDGTITSFGIDSIVGVGNNDAMGDDTYLLNNLYGVTIPYETISDPWGVSSSGEFQAFGIELYSLDTSLFSSTAFQPNPPGLTQSVISLFYIEELDESGNSIYLATGKLTSVTSIPTPPAVWLFGTGLIGLLGIHRNRKR